MFVVCDGMGIDPVGLYRPRFPSTDPWLCACPVYQEGAPEDLRTASKDRATRNEKELRTTLGELKQDSNGSPVSHLNNTDIEKMADPPCTHEKSLSGVGGNLRKSGSVIHGESEASNGCPPASSTAVYSWLFVSRSAFVF